MRGRFDGRGGEAFPFPWAVAPVCVFAWWAGVYSLRGFSRVIGLGAQGGSWTRRPCSVVAEWDTLILRGKERVIVAGRGDLLFCESSVLVPLQSRAEGEERGWLQGRMGICEMVVHRVFKANLPTCRRI